LTALNDTITYGSAKFKVVKNLTSNNIDDYLGDVNVSSAVVASDAPVGYITWQMSLLRDYLKLDGTNLADASTDYKELLDYAQDNNLITNDSSNKALFKYNSNTDVLTLPNYIDLVLQGGSTVEEKEAGLPNIKGEYFGSAEFLETPSSEDANIRGKSGAFTNSKATATVGKLQQVTTATGAGQYKTNMKFSANSSNSIYSDSVDTVQPPAITLIPQIKYRKDTSNTLYNDTPIGTVISYMGNTAPKDYLACDGTVYNIIDYKELAEYIKAQFGSYNYFGGDGTTTFAVPDLRGEFLRGTGTNSHTNQGSGSNVGVHQDGTEIPNVHYNGTKLQMDVNTSETKLAVVSEDKAIKTTGGRLWAQSSTTTGSDNFEVRRAYTSRPTNTSVLYCIKYNTSVLSTPENNYSTEEQRIGTWIDGKPIYQITVDCGALPNSTVKTITLPLEKTIVKEIIDIKGICYNYNSGQPYWRSIPKIQDNYTTLNVTVQFILLSNQSNAVIQLMGRTTDSSDFTKSYVTIQYTKTTD